jgi:hypothetical protein
MKLVYTTRVYTFMVAIALIAMTMVASADTIVKGEVKFQKGKAATTIEDGLARGEENEYTVKAKAGQTMTVSITSVEKNAVFELLELAEGGERTPFFDNNGKEVREATKWKGKLPGNGAQTYLIVVGATRGGADYKLKVEIK